MRRGKGKKEQIWSNASAFDLRLALREAQHWIEAVTNTMFPTNDFHQAMKDGVLLCRLANKIKPGSVPKIQTVNTAGPRLPERDKRYSVAFDNAANSASKFAEIDNISSFIRACKQFGLKETLLFTAMDLHNGTTYGLRAVAVTLYWVGRVAAAAGFSGPKLNLSVFTSLTCSLCKNPIIGDEYVVTMERQYHVQCSKCNKCEKSLTEVEKFALVGGVPVCCECNPDGVSDESLVAELTEADKEAMRKQEEAERRAKVEERLKLEAEKKASEQSKKASLQQRIQDAEERARQERRERSERLERLQREKEARRAKAEQEKKDTERRKAEEANAEKARKEKEAQEAKEREAAKEREEAKARQEAAAKEAAAKEAEEVVKKKAAEERLLAEKRDAEAKEAKAKEEEAAEAERQRKEAAEQKRKEEEARKETEKKAKEAEEEEEKRHKEREEESARSRKSPSDEKKGKSSRKTSNADGKKVTKARKATADASDCPKVRKKPAKKKRKKSDARGSKREKDAIDVQEGKERDDIKEKEKELKEREREVREKEKELEMLLELAKKEEKQQEKKKEEERLQEKKKEEHSSASLSTSTSSFYPNKEGTMFISQKQGPKAKWKKHHVELVDSSLRILSQKGGKEVRVLPPGSVTVAGLVQTKSKKRSAYLILSSSPSMMISTASNDLEELKEWSSAIMKSTRLHQARSKRIINQPNKRMSEGFSKEIQLAFSENNTAQRLYLQPQKSKCELCEKHAPTWTTEGHGSQRQLCLQCHQTRQVDESAKKMRASARKAAKAPKKKKFGTLKSSALMSLAERREDDTRTKRQLQEKFRRMQIEKRQDAILGTSIEESDNSATNSSNSRIVARVRNSYSIRQLLTNVEANDGSDTDDDFDDMTFEDDSEGSGGEEGVPAISICSDFVAYELADDGPGSAFSFEDLARAYGGVDVNSEQRASSDSLHTEGGFLSPLSARGSRFSVSSFSELSCRSSVRGSSKFSLDDDDDDCSSGTGLSGNSVGDWNGRFQSIMQELATHSPNTPESEQISANLALLGLAHDFLYSATAYGKIIISEVYLPDSEKTIKPVNMGGVAGGSKYIVHNILFKFALDTEGLYGKNDAAAAKVGGHELKGMQAHFHCNIPHLHLPLMALVDYRGFRVLAISLLPINNSTIVYGTNDGGNTMFNKDRAMDKMMLRAAEILNLQQHKAGLNPANQETIYSAADIEGHLGTDHRRYLVDFSRTFPPEKPSSGIQGCNLSRLLRPEFVKRNPTPLCSDAYSNFLNKQELAAANREIDEATEYLRGPLITMFVPALAELLEPHLDDVGSFRLTEAVHRQGINMRHLGRLFVAITPEAVPELVTRETCRALVMVEMLARCIKQDLRTRLRNRMKQKKLPLEEPYRKLVLDYLNLVFGNSALSDEYWDTKIIVSVQRHFPGMRKEELKKWILSAEKQLNTVEVEKKMVMYLEQEEAKSGKKGKGAKNQEMQRAAAAAAAAAAVTGGSSSGAPHLLSKSVKSRESASVFKKVLSFFPTEHEGVQVLLSRVQSMMGLKFSPKCLAELDSHLALKLSVDKPFVRTDLDEIGERIKYMNIMAQVEGYLLLVKGWQTRSQDSDSAMCYYDMAIKKFEEVLNSNTNSKVTLRNCAQALASQEEEACHAANRKLTRELPRLARANDYFQKAIEVDPTDPITHFQYATFLEQCECYDEAEDNYLVCLELDANFVEALHSYGNLLQLRGDFPAAERFFARVMQYSDTVSSSSVKAGGAL